MPASTPTRAQAVSHLSLIAAEPPRSVAERMADVFVSNDEEGRVTVRADLHREGFSDDEIDANQVAAIQIAARRQAKSKARDINATPEKSVEDVRKDMCDIISSLLPPTQLIVAELQARGIPQKHIDLLLPKARAMSAHDFALGQTGWAN